MVYPAKYSYGMFASADTKHYIIIALLNSANTVNSFKQKCRLYTEWRQITLLQISYIFNVKTLVIRHKSGFSEISKKCSYSVSLFFFSSENQFCSISSNYIKRIFNCDQFIGLLVYKEIILLIVILKID